MEQKYFGFWGRILRINLTTKETTVEQLDPKLYRKYMGGRNLALHFLIKELDPNIDPLSEENKLLFMTSVATGAPIAGQARHTAAALSPLTGGIADSQCGGYWGAELKFAGWDGVIIEGKSAEQVYISINDENVEILSAHELWGKETGEVQELLLRKHGKVRVLQVGPAGENLVRFACITSDLKNFHGRGGLGAVMGSKNLRAVIVNGSHRKLRLADPEGLNRIATKFARSTKQHPAISLHHELGTSKGVFPVSVAGMLPTYNFQDGSFTGAEAIGGETMKRELKGRGETCYGCAVACKRSIEGGSEKFQVSRRYGGPEYESIGLLGSNVGIDDISVVAFCNELCNRLGLDTISMGCTISWALECYERDLLTMEDTQGKELKWNDPELMVELIEKTARKEGLGKLLAEGSRRAARIIGRDTEKYAMQVKGQELANHEPRGKWGVGLGYAVSPTGADHLQAAHDPWFTQPGDYSTEYNWVDLEDLSPLGLLDPVPSEYIGAEKVRLFVYLQYIWGLHDVLDWCIFTTVPEFRAMSLKELADIIACITGWRTSLFELIKAGERGVTMARAFNYIHGFSASDDYLPERFFEPMREGTLKGHFIDKEKFYEAIRLYYSMMGWDEAGKPTVGKLEELAVGWINSYLAD